MSTTSSKFSLNSADFWKSLAMAALMPSVFTILTALYNGHFNINWTQEWQMAVSSAAGYLLKNFFSGPPSPPTNGGANITSTLRAKTLILLLLLSSACSAQSIFKPLPLTPKPTLRHGPVFNRVVIGPTDSLPNISNGHFKGFRFSGPDVAFAIPDFSVYTGLGIDYVMATADPSSGKWTYDFTIGPRVYGGANLGAPTVRTLGAIGIRATFFKGWLAVGGIYSLTLKKAQATMGNPAALIPGLN